MILGSGIAPVPEVLREGMAVGLGVDGSASNDTSNMIREARQAMLLARVRFGADAMTARQALALSTIGGARVLHREEELGSLEPGKCADLVLFDLSSLEFAGAADAVAALVHCGAQYADLVMVNGEVRVRGGRLVDERLYDFISRQRQISRKLVGAR
jgi:cytosine/adenosine deaminase-related metal-dependent hydrolase